MKCHGTVEANPNDSHDLGYHLRPWDCPEEMPVLLHGKTWVKLSSGKAEYTDIDKGER